VSDPVCPSWAVGRVVRAWRVGTDTAMLAVIVVCVVDSRGRIRRVPRAR
jgi:hypothetical protein